MSSSVHEQVSILGPKGLQQLVHFLDPKLYSSDICHMTYLQLMSAQSDAVLTADLLVTALVD